MSVSKLLTFGTLFLNSIATPNPTSLRGPTTDSISDYVIDDNTMNSVTTHNMRTDTPYRSQTAICFGKDCLVVESETDSSADHCQGSNCGRTLNIPRSAMPQMGDMEDGRYKIDDLVEKIIELNNNEITEDAKKAVYNAETIQLNIEELEGIQGEAWRAKISAETPEGGQKHAGMIKTLEDAGTDSSPFETLEAAVKEFNKTPILVLENTNGEKKVLDGHHRFYSFQGYNKKHPENKIEQIPAHIIHIGDISFEQIIKECHELGYPHKSLTGDKAFPKTVTKDTLIQDDLIHRDNMEVDDF